MDIEAEIQRTYRNQTTQNYGYQAVIVPYTQDYNSTRSKSSLKMGYNWGPSGKTDPISKSTDIRKKAPGLPPPMMDDG
jgi:hypothetical protein